MEGSGYMLLNLKHEINLDVETWKKFLKHEINTMISQINVMIQDQFFYCEQTNEVNRRIST